MRKVGVMSEMSAFLSILKTSKLVFLILVVCFLLLSLIPLVLAANNDTSDDAVARAYQCLENKVKDKNDCKDLSAEEQAFSLLALAYKSSIQGDCKKELLAKSKDNECWPSNGCRLRDTAIAVTSLDNINSNTDDAKDWLLAQRKTPDLEWYLEIDADEATTCKILYTGENAEIIIKEDKKINHGAGTCLTLAQSGYWLRIADNCLEKNFTISCNKNFITTLLYKKPNSDVWHVSSETNSAAADGKTEEKVNSYCFKQNNNCNYEGSLWAALALMNTGYDINAYLPYLIAYAEDNDQFGPDAFLYMFITFNDYYTNIINSQNTQGYWDLSSPYTRYYDTALNLFALSSSSSYVVNPVSNAQEWLLESQAEDGCWKSNREIADTAFLLYAGWPKTPASGGVSIEYCESSDYYCISSADCRDAGGNTLSQFSCANVVGGASKICCDVDAQVKTCLEQLGDLCTSGEVCIGNEVTSSNQGTCCVGTCTPPAQEPECEEKGYTCKVSCSDDEESKSFECSSGDTCCGEKTSKGGSYWWIWILIILIILVVLGIIFRDRLRMYIFKFKNKFTAGTAEPRRPGFPPAGNPIMMSRPIFSRPMRPIPRRPGGPIRKATSALDKELDDTLKKLREMGK